MNTIEIHNKFGELDGIKSNYYKHRTTALHWSQMLSGKHWTDYNEHDPGVTILEALCYTLTEIEYKLDFSIEEILKASNPKGQFNIMDNALYLAEDILTSAPVTVTDYRKLIIDRVDEINNAWLIPEKQKKKQKQNKEIENYNVVVLKKKNVKFPDEAARSTQELLSRFRGYGARKMEVYVAKFYVVFLNADIHISENYSAEEVLAEMFFNLNEEILNVNPLRQPFTELEDEGLSYDDIFNGPNMINGIVVDEHLNKNFDSISLVKIKKIIASTIGVEMLSELSINHKHVCKKDKHKKIHKLKFPLRDVEAGETVFRVPFFSPKSGNSFRVFKRNKVIDFDTAKISEIIARKSRKIKRDYLLKNSDQYKTYNFFAEDRNISDYYSIRNDFPGAYGLIKKGFSLIQNQDPTNFDQLKRFLLPFEQVLANSFIRLSKVGALFSIDSDLNRTIHRPLLIPNKSSATSSFDLSELDTNSKPQFTQGIDEDPRYELIRRNKFLTHLLARFNFEIVDNTELHVFNDEEHHYQQQIESKQNILKVIDKITYNRPIYDTLNSQDFNDSNYSNSYPYSSLEYELYQRIGIHTPPERPLYKAVSELEKNIQRIKIEEIDELDYGSVKLKYFKTFEYDNTDFGFHANTKELLLDFLKTAIYKSSYAIFKSEADKHHIGLKSTKENVFIKIATLKTKANALEKVSSLIKRTNAISKTSEGFYLLDHSLLKQKDLHKKAKKRAKKLTEFRLSFVFPNWTKRFNNQAFQEEVVQIVYDIIPAHLLANCYWLNLKEMVAFEDAFKNWTLIKNDDSKINDQIKYSEILTKIITQHSKQVNTIKSDESSNTIFNI